MKRPQGFDRPPAPRAADRAAAEPHARRRARGTGVAGARHRRRGPRHGRAVASRRVGAAAATDAARTGRHEPTADRRSGRPGATPSHRPVGRRRPDGAGARATGRSRRRRGCRAADAGDASRPAGPAAAHASADGTSARRCAASRRSRRRRHRVADRRRVARGARRRGRGRRLLADHGAARRARRGRPAHPGRRRAGARSTTSSARRCRSSTRAEVHAALAEFPLIETYSTESDPARHARRAHRRARRRSASSTPAIGPRARRLRGRRDRPPRRACRTGQPLIEVDGGVAGEGFRAVARGRAQPAGRRARPARAVRRRRRADDVRLELAGGASVVWGSADDSALKADRARRRSCARRRPTRSSQYDVSAPSSAVTE